VTIEDPGCVAKTFPDYFAVLARLAAPPPGGQTDAAGVAS
jgi:hypothetical protein